MFVAWLPGIVISTPEVTCTDLCPEDEFLVMGSDGVWDVMEPQVRPT